MTQLVPKPQLVHANSAISVSRQIGLIAGPVLGGSLVSLAGPEAAFWFNSSTFLLSAVLLALIPARLVAKPPPPDENDKEAPGTRRGLLREIGDGVGYVAGVRWLRLTLATGAVANAVFAGGLDVLVPLIFTQTDATGATRLGLFYALQGGGALLGVLVLAHLAVRQVGWPLFGMIALMSGCLVLVGVFGNSWVSLALAAGYGLGMHFFNSLYPALVQATVPATLVSRVSSLEFVAFDGLMPLGVLLMGPLSESLGPRRALGVTGLAITAISVAVVFAPSIRVLRFPDNEQSINPPGHRSISPSNDATMS